MMCIMPPQHSAKIFARRISTSLFRCRSGRRMTPVREERLDYIFSLRVTGHTGCLRVCLPSCRARDGRVLHSRLEPIPCRDTYAIGFLPKSRSDVYVCVRVRLEIAMIFEAFSAVWQPRAVCSRHNFHRLSFIHPLKRARLTWRECET